MKGRILKTFAWISIISLISVIFYNKLLSKQQYARVESTENFLTTWVTNKIREIKIEYAIANKFEDVDSTHNKSSGSNNRRTVIIILANHRSGSSFFGELFAQHEDTLYLFEPLFPLSQSQVCDRNNDVKAKITSELAKCNFPNWKEIIPKLKHHFELSNFNMRGCITKQSCFRRQTNLFCTGKYCNENTNTKQCGRCPPVNLNMAAEDCKRKVLVLKLIRLCDLESIKDAFIQADIDVKLLHLIRDPRGITRSRRNVMRNINITDSVKSTCNRQLTNYRFATQQPPVWLQQKYMVLRYEDVALHPYEMTRKVYRFVGLTLTEGVKEWIKTHTLILDPELLSSAEPQDMLKKVFAKIGVEFGKLSFNIDEYIASLPPGLQVAAQQYHQLIKQQKVVMNPYGILDKRSSSSLTSPTLSTVRNSKEIVEKWKNVLKYNLVRTVQSVCNELMHEIGYLKVSNEDEYENKDNSYIDDSFYHTYFI